MYNIEMKLIIGIDEAGRGPLAGPISVGVFGAEEKIGKWLLKHIFDLSAQAGNKLRDSKKLSPKKREEIYKKFCELKKSGKLFFSVSHISNTIIDQRGLTYATKLGIKKSLIKLQHENKTNKDAPCSLEKCGVIRLDGLLKAPAEFKNQKTIIKGDEKDIFIACASIVAKVRRDRLMCRLVKKFPNYSFEIHKGYGTALHYKLIKKNGISPIHRKSFLSSLS
jgi:ribonuclease HII